MEFAFQPDFFVNDEQNKDYAIEKMNHLAQSQIDLMYRDFGLREKPEVPKVRFFDSESKKGEGYFQFRGKVYVDIGRKKKSDFQEEVNTLSHEISHYLHHEALGRKEFMKFYSSRKVPRSKRMTFVLRSSSYQGWCEIIAQHATFDFNRKEGSLENFLRLETPPEIRGRLDRRHFDVLYKAYEQNPSLWKTMVQFRRDEIKPLLSSNFQEEFFIESVIKYFKRGLK